MLDESITECNKLIAEFMSVYKDANEEYDFEDHPLEYTVSLRSSNTCIQANTMLFHESWEWLMPVVEKIENLGFEYSYYKGKAVITDFGFQNMKNDIEYSGARLEGTWLVIVEFIKWYNENVSTHEYKM